MEKYGTVGQATDEKITWLMLIACWLPKATDTNTHTHTHTHKHGILNTAFLDFTRQTRASKLRFTLPVLFNQSWYERHATGGSLHFIIQSFITVITSLLWLMIIMILLHYKCTLKDRK